MVWVLLREERSSLWDLQMCEFTEINNIVLPMITFKISLKFSPHYTKLSIFSKTIQSTHCWKNCIFLNVHFIFPVQGVIEEISK